ncbi:MAG: UDP-glucose 4-epimerase GalE [Polyangiaceae bacterium]
MSEATKRVLVTGGAGYIGSHTVVELRAAGYEPIIVDNFCASERTVIDGLTRILGQAPAVHERDCRDAAGMRAVFQRHAPIAGVIHFAAHKSVGVSVSDPLAYHDNNVGSLVTVLAVMAEAGVQRLVFSSSCTVYGQPDRLPVSEETPFKPAESPYGRTKQFSEAIITDVVKATGLLEAVTLRYFNPVGAHPSAAIGELPLGKPENLVPFITQTAVGLRDELVVFGSDYPTPDGTCVRDYIHVLDLARAHVAALDWLGRRSVSGNEVFNLGMGKGVSVLEAIAAFEAASGVRLPYRLGPPRPGDVVEIYASVDKARRVLGWRTERSFIDAMRDAYNWQLALGAR